MDKRIVCMISVMVAVLCGCDSGGSDGDSDGSSTGGAMQTRALDLSSIVRVEVEVHLDNASYTTTSYNGPQGTTLVDYAQGAEYNGEFTSVAGSTSYATNVFRVDFYDVPVLGQTISGFMTVAFVEGTQVVGVRVYQSKTWNSLLVGATTVGNILERDGIPFSRTYTDTTYDQEVDEYVLSGSAVSGATVQHAELNDQYKEELTGYTAGSGSYLKVRVYYRSTV